MNEQIVAQARHANATDELVILTGRDGTCPTEQPEQNRLDLVARKGPVPSENVTKTGIGNFSSR
ncbi:hypothetical protein [Sphingomonas daechungensis]|uniref:hypothetical protein n=1 Tax=Sphingomonas daechungensis TaxID=1176646 RepID=UPI0031E76E91